MTDTFVLGISALLPPTFSLVVISLLKWVKTFGVGHEALSQALGRPPHRLPSVMGMYLKGWGELGGGEKGIPSLPSQCLLGP